MLLADAKIRIIAFAYRLETDVTMWHLQKNEMEISPNVFFYSLAFNRSNLEMKLFLLRILLDHFLRAKNFINLTAY